MYNILLSFKQFTFYYQIMKVAVFGHKGWIASHVLDYLNHQQIEVVYDDTLRAENQHDVEQFLYTTQPTHVLCMLGRTHGPGFPTIDYLEQPGKLIENLRDNLFAPLLLSQLSTKYKYHFTYLGTGCIYHMDNPLDYAFQEYEPPNFFGSSYSIVKGVTDQLLRNQENTLILRIRLPIIDSHHPRNFITKLVKYTSIQSEPNSVSVLPTLIPCMIDMMKLRYHGVVNLVNPGHITHNEILEMYKEIVDPTISWKNVSSEEMGSLVCAKRCNNILDTRVLEMLYPDVPPAKEAVQGCISHMSI